jgi:hypothetical protein
VAFQEGDFLANGELPSVFDQLLQGAKVMASEAVPIIAVSLQIQE